MILTIDVGDALIIGYDRKKVKDHSVLIVGRETRGRVDIINTFQGKEADEIYTRLLTLNKKGEERG